MKTRTILTTIAAAIAACGGASTNQRSATPAEEPVSTTTTTSALVVVTPATPTLDSPPTSEDRELVERVVKHLAKQADLRGNGWRDLQIVARDGRVTISGELSTIAESSEVELVVREVDGVRAVDNEIRRSRDGD